MEPVLAFFRRIWGSLKEYWQSQESGAKTRFILISGVALVGLIAALYYLARVDYVTLYDAGTPASERKAAQDALTAAGIRTRVYGSELLVDRRREGDAMLELAALDLTDTYNYDQIIQGSGFGVSESERRTWMLVYTEAQIDRKLSQSPKIQSARVQIAQPNNTSSLFAGEIVPVTASVHLVLIEPLTSDEVDGVVSTVAYAYPGLSMDNISVTDQHMNILNRSSQSDITQLTQQHDFEQLLQDSFNRAVLTHLQPMFGANHVRVTSNVAVDFDDVSLEEVIFTAPNEEDMEGLVVSARSQIEKATGATPNPGGQPGIDENGWDPIYAETDALTGSTWSSSIQETNYEINQAVRRVQEAKGKITALTITVTVDSLIVPSEDQNESAVRAIAAGSVGLMANDAPHINVQFVPYYNILREQEIAASIAETMRSQEFYALIKTLALYLIIGLCIVLLIHRIYRFLRPPAADDELLEMQGLDDELDEYADLLRLTTEPEDIEATKSPERLKLEDFIDRSPDMVANLLRNWLSDELPRGRH
ncbi:MAG: hypothetical protein FWH06_01925 [Oscillospiraceae bacterium]|nr:hypothetical protein [Oscillospiraceae bacterium]